MELCNGNQKKGAMPCVPQVYRDLLTSQEEIAGSTFRSTGANREMVARLVVSAKAYGGLTYAGLIQSMSPPSPAP